MNTDGGVGQAYKPAFSRHTGSPYIYVKRRLKDKGGRKNKPDKNDRGYKHPDNEPIEDILNPENRVIDLRA